LEVGENLRCKSPFKVKRAGGMAQVVEHLPGKGVETLPPKEKEGTGKGKRKGQK
jgi:hypothetical protein